MTVIYADSVFMINTAVDYLVLLITGRLAGIPLQRKRFLAAALLGGFYGVAAVVPGLDFLMSVSAKGLVWLLMSLIAYGFSSRFLKLMLLSGAVSCALAGVILCLGMLVSNHLAIALLPKGCRVLLLCGICISVLCSVLFRTCAHPGVEGILVPVSLSIAGKTLALAALLDTGNQLRDPVTGEPILVVSLRAIQSALPRELKDRLSAERLQIPADLLEEMFWFVPELSPKLLPYRALGIPSGTLLALRADWVKIRNTTYWHTNVAIAPFDLGLGYSALWGGALKGESTAHDVFETTMAVAAESTER